MGIRNFVSNFLFGIDQQIERKVDMRMRDIEYYVPGAEYSLSNLLRFRQQEYKIWSTGNPIDLLKFYNTYKIAPGETNGTSRQLFWEWVSAIDTVPKIHYPAPEIVMNQMKSLIFAEELDINVDTGNEEKSSELNDLLQKMLDENDVNEKYQTGSYMETYSGTLAFKMMFDTDISEYPFFIPYPAEKLQFREKHGKVLEVIFIDEYDGKNDKYRLKSHYGRGYINYRLYRLKSGKEEQVQLSAIEETKDLKDIYITHNGKALPLLLAVYKKNRSVSNEFPNSLYGGSDFEGVTDMFHVIDELYSQKSLYIRRSRPIQTIREDMLDYNVDTKKHTIPKEYKQDTIIVKPTENAKDSESRMYRDIPDLNLTPYDESIKNELKSIFSKIGMSYTTVGLEAHSANISGAALKLKEKSTVIVRSNKIKLWNKFLKDVYRLLFIYNSLKDITPRDTEEGQIYAINDTFDYKIQIEFPAYNHQTFDERIDDAIKGIQGQIFDVETAVDRALGKDYTEEQKKQIVRNIKLENGITLIGDQLEVEEA